MNKRENGHDGVESLRHLVAGTAHDLNNLLMVVNECAELALLDDTLAPRTRQLMHEILDAGERSKLLTRQIMTLGKPPLIRPTAVDVAALLTSSATLLGRMIGDRVRLNLDVASAPLWVVAEASQVEQVIVNLALNARDAMPTGGTLAIKAAAVDSPGAGRNREAGCVARLTVSDTGTGIDPAVRDRMYEPYVTTKSSDQGCGLGLAVVRGIVDELGGSIDVATVSGNGTTFAIDLPLARVTSPPS